MMENQDTLTIRLWEYLQCQAYGLSTEQLRLMKFAAGFSYGAVQNHVFILQRNFSAYAEDNLFWQQLVMKGYAEKHPCTRTVFYTMTQNGIEKLEKILNVNIYSKTQ